MRFIGCKALLLDNIKSVIDENAPDAKSFCDIFSGTATVARYFKQWYEVTSNDLLYFSYVLQRGTVAVDCLPTYEILQENTGISDPVAYFNGLSLEQMERLPPERRFFQNTYAPIGGRMYINDENALRIDFARNITEDWRKVGFLSDDEYYYLVACIVEGIPFVSNDVLIEWSKKYYVTHIEKSYTNCSYHFKDRAARTMEVLVTNYKWEETRCEQLSLIPE